MAVKGLGDAIPIKGEKPESPAKAPSGASGYDMALDDLFDALKSGDREGFKAAFRDCLDLKDAPALEDDDF